MHIAISTKQWVGQWKGPSEETTVHSSARVLNPGPWPSANPRHFSSWAVPEPESLLPPSWWVLPAQRELGTRSLVVGLYMLSLFWPGANFAHAAELVCGKIFFHGTCLPSKKCWGPLLYCTHYYTVYSSLGPFCTLKPLYYCNWVEVEL